jgi:hypothetical protein
MPLDPGLALLGLPVTSEGKWPRPLCPVCQEGYLRFGKPEECEDAASRGARDHDAWEPEWIFGTFILKAVCEHDQCLQEVRVLGKFQVEEGAGDYPYEDRYRTSYKVTFVNPSLMMMRLPESAPNDVVTGVARASAVLFVDPSLAATALRSAVESFLSAQGVVSSNGRSGYRSLESRLTEWKHAHPERSDVADLFLAVKWIGNEGSHEMANLAVGDVITGANLLDEAFHRLFVGPDLDARAEAIIAARGSTQSRLASS